MDGWRNRGGSRPGFFLPVTMRTPAGISGGVNNAHFLRVSEDLNFTNEPGASKIIRKR